MYPMYVCVWEAGVRHWQGGLMADPRKLIVCSYSQMIPYVGECVLYHLAGDAESALVCRYAM